MSSALRFSENVEIVPGDEADDVAKILEILRRGLARQAQSIGRPVRGVHVKSDACVRGTFEIVSGLPVELAQGLFASPAVYPALVRFSNAAASIRPDVAPDTRGLAIKVEGVPGPHLQTLDGSSTTQDFLMANHSTFFAANVKAYLGFERTAELASEHPGQLALQIAKRFWNPTRRPWATLSAAARVVTQVPTHPALQVYDSLIPYRFGDYVARYRARLSHPLESAVAHRAKLLATDRNAMRTMIRETLVSQDLRFDFEVQLRTSEGTMPVEDATVRWPEAESPFRRVATLVLPRQAVASRPDGEECENQSFDVWNALEAHRPLGGINRMRQDVYFTSAQTRGARGPASH